MHCSVGLAILVKVGPISGCFDTGTQSFSMVGTPVSLMPRNSADAKVVVFDYRGGVIMQATAHLFRMRPAAEHVGGALAYEFAARIGEMHRRADLKRGLSVR